jgi:DNA-binding response OmpR family regulator
MGKTIAVFNPSPTELLLYRAILERRGYTIVAYQSNHLNLDAIDRIEPTLMIIDGMRGWHTDDLSIIERLSVHPTLSQLPILILTTALGGLLETPYLQQLGQISYLVKPFAAQTLLERVQHAQIVAVS